MAQQYINPFTWSMRRREMFDRCLREYFYHYYGSAGGAFTGTVTTRAEQLHLLRGALSVEEYAKSKIYEALRALWASGKNTAENFLPALKDRFAVEFKAMLLGRPEHDHKLPLLRELTEQGISLQELEEKVLKALQSRSELLHADALKQLLSIPVSSRLFLPFPLKVNWNDLDCYVTPLAAWHSENELSFVCTGKASEENSALLSLYALEHFNTAPDKVKIFHLESGTLQHIPMPRSFSGAFRRIREDADRMLLLELKLKTAPLPHTLFPQDLKQCAQCRFRSFCQ